MGQHKKSFRDELLSGAGFTLLFGLFYLKSGGFLWLIPLFILGIRPLIRGVTRMLEYRSRTSAVKPRVDSKESKIQREREILKLAKQRNGILTVTTAALDSSLSLEQTEKVLSDLSDRGYARMEVEDDGTISYRFPDFLKESP
ncbi:MAG: hypothetical protein R6V67_08975 [Spirochaetia bacterium]